MRATKTKKHSTKSISPRQVVQKKMNSTVLHVRIDRRTKEVTESYLEQIGMTPSQAINLFYNQIIIRNGFPLELHTPNQLTARTLKKARNGKDIQSYQCARELFDTWTQA